ncbi:hypothetical protein BIW11_06817, partial [Tropilaelaps mercedesae]
CPCQPPVPQPVATVLRPAVSTSSAVAGVSDLMSTPLSSYYQRQVQPQRSSQQENSLAPLDPERFRRPVESPALRESHSCLGSSQQNQHQQQHNHGPNSVAQHQQLEHQGSHRNGYHDLEETSSESSSTRIPSRMSGDPNVTTSTENDTRQLMNGHGKNPPLPYSSLCAAFTKPAKMTTTTMPTTTAVIHHGIPHNKKESGLYSKLPPSSRQTLIRAMFCSSALIALLTALCVLLLVMSSGRGEDGGSVHLSENTFGAPVVTGIGSAALSVVPPPTDLVDRSQVIIVNRRNPTQLAEQATQLSDLLTLVNAYNATTRDAAFPSQLIQTVQPGCTVEEHFGYRRGEPCVAIVLRPDPTFVPVPLPSGADTDAVDRSSNLLELECLCENRRSVKIAYSPFRGFPLRFFPRSARASPLLVMLRFGDLPLKTELRISCGLRGAQNIDPRSNRVNFQIMVI